MDCIEVHLNILSWIFMFVGMLQMILYSCIMCSVCGQPFTTHLLQPAAHDILGCCVQCLVLGAAIYKTWRDSHRVGREVCCIK